MGVPGFSAWLARTACPQAFQDATGRRFDHVFVDVASLLHKVVRHATSVNHLHMLLYLELDGILSRCQPRKSVLIAFDGPAPLAKLLTQRSRRTAKARKEERDGVGDGGRRRRGMSSLALTPGTLLMLDLEQSLAFYVAQRLQTSWAHLHFELSGARVPGEGEMKLLGRLLAPAVPAAPGDRTAVIGGDSDLLVMALLAGHGDVWVLPDASGGGGGGGGKGARGRKRVAGAGRGFSLRALEQAWAALPAACGGPARLAALRADLAALSLLGCGNDYLPGVLGCPLESGPARRGLWDAYLGLRASAAWADRQLVLRDGDGAPPRLDLQLLAALLERQAQGGRGRAGVEWVLGMYAAGRCRDYRFVYDRQAPDAAQLAAAAAGGELRAADAPERGPLLPAACALALLPRARGQAHTPAALRGLMEPGSPIAELYAECAECDARLAAAKAADAALAAAVARQTQLDEAAAVAAAEEELLRLREASRAAADARLAHLLAAHPHRPFPVAAVEAAVAAVPREHLPPDEQPLLEFGVPHAFWRAAGRKCCCASCRGGGGADACAYAFPAPQPPTPKMTPVASEGLRRRPLPEAGSLPPAPGEVVPGCRCPACWSRTGGGKPLGPPRRAPAGRRRRPPPVRPAAGPVAAAAPAPGRARFGSLARRAAPAGPPACRMLRLGRQALSVVQALPRFC